jgi:hypothetical protein
MDSGSPPEDENNGGALPVRPLLFSRSANVKAL